MTRRSREDFAASKDADEYSAPEGEFPRSARAVLAAAQRPHIDLGRLVALLGGIAGFVFWASMPALPDALDPEGRQFALNEQGQLAIGLFVLAAIWWVFEVLPVGITAVTIAVVQAVFEIRDSRTAFTDFMDPAVWFIIGALTIGTAFARTGLTNRIAYRMLSLVGERTSAIYFGSFCMTACLTLVMAQTAVAAAVFPLFAVIYAAYADDSAPTRFGKGLFVGMAFTAGAGSIVTLFGAARGAVAIGLYRDLVGREVNFFELSYYMLPVGLVMVVLLWLYMLLIYPPEKNTITGLRERAVQLRRTRGPLSEKEWLTIVITLAAVLAMSLRSMVPFLATRFQESEGAFSPDGRWVAYQSNESGRTEVYVRPFPPAGGRWQVSDEGGAYARWSHDGRELYYRTENTEAFKAFAGALQPSLSRRAPGLWSEVARMGQRIDPTDPLFKEWGSTAEPAVEVGDEPPKSASG